MPRKPVVAGRSPVVRPKGGLPDAAERGKRIAFLVRLGLTSDHAAAIAAPGLTRNEIMQNIVQWQRTLPLQ